MKKKKIYISIAWQQQQHGCVKVAGSPPAVNRWCCFVFGVQVGSRNRWLYGQKQRAIVCWVSKNLSIKARQLLESCKRWVNEASVGEDGYHGNPCTRSPFLPPPSPPGTCCDGFHTEQSKSRREDTLRKGEEEEDGSNEHPQQPDEGWGLWEADESAEPQENPSWPPSLNRAQTPIVGVLVFLCVLFWMFVLVMLERALFIGCAVCV